MGDLAASSDNIDAWLAKTLSETVDVFASRSLRGSNPCGVALLVVGEVGYSRTTFVRDHCGSIIGLAAVASRKD